MPKKEQTTVVATKAEKEAPSVVEEVSPVVENEVQPVEQPAKPNEFLVCNGTDTFDPNRLLFVATDERENAKQHVNWVQYLYNTNVLPTRENKVAHSRRLTFVTLPIYMEKGGIPSYNKEYHGDCRNHRNRGFFYIPYIEGDEGSMKFFDMMEQIDKFMISEINEKKNVNGVLSMKSKKGQLAPFKKLVYNPIVGMSKPREGDDDTTDHKYKPFKRVKVQFEIEKGSAPQNSSELGKISTRIFVGNKVEPEEVNTVDDAANFLAWKCKAEFAIESPKAWVQKSVTNVAGTELRQSGITFRCPQIHITELAAQIKKLSTMFNQNIFVRKQNPALQAATVAAVAPKVASKSKQHNKQTDDDETDSHQNDEPASDEEEQAPKNQSNTTKNTKADKDDEQSDNEHAQSSDSDTAQASDNDSAPSSDDEPEPKATKSVSNKTVAKNVTSNDNEVHTKTKLPRKSNR